MIRKEKEFKQLNDEICACVKCRLSTTRQFAVPGEGPLGAEFMFLGQGPGREEDKTGRPFIGRAGKLLTKLLESAGLDREKVFITSAVKCLPTPPLNRKPKPDELAACFPYLERQLHLIKPQKIVLLGDVAFQMFFPKEKLRDYRGKWADKEGRKFFVTYHPAAALRFLSMKKILEEDFKKIRPKKDEKSGV